MPSFKQMDIDAYTAAHRDEWERLAQLGRQSQFTGPEADELIDRYQAGAAQLSAIRSTAGQSLQGDRLSLYLSRARLRFTGASSNVLSRMPAFFLRAMPAALYRIRWLSLAIAFGTAVIAVLYFVWVSGDPRVFASLGDQEAMKQYAMQDFVSYYSDYSGSSFTAFVWTNNAWLAAQCVAFGITGVFPLAILLTTGQSLGQMAAVLEHYDRLDVFLLYIAPHGQLELYSIFVAGAAGLAIFWSWVAPGSQSRGRSLAAGGRSLFTVAIALMLSLFVSGIIEGFVTRQPWPWPIKIGIGTLALAGFLCYQWILGRKAHRLGETGDLDEFEAGATQLTAG
jgi:uncharacterized membrane protein SpoIIM required for sporulation